VAERARILVGERYFDAESRRVVVVRDEIIRRSGGVPERTGRFVVEATEGPRVRVAYVAPASALEAVLPVVARRHGPPRHVASVLRHALCGVKAAALARCETDEERAIASALAECGIAGTDALRALARVLLEAARREDEKEESL
jgi:hypothetical protein